MHKRATTVLERQFAAFELPPEVHAVVYGDDGYATAMLAFPASARWACVDVELSAGYPAAPPVVLVTASSDDAMLKEAVARAASATSPCCNPTHITMMGRTPVSACNHRSPSYR